ncbi:hypothetical protein [Haloarcula litorea]|uniref:hypothetical protein n=1 Tax=Haloarcula litorea TaxID=3032579 RepID=UPI0023E79A4B|nr:hypothetical protein [Halomicroarcula sp. GDY20]
MAMGPLAVAGTALAVVNSVLLLVVGGVWLRNYRQFRSNMVLGLVAFSAVLLLENLVAVYFFFDSMTMLYAADPLVGQVVLVMRTLQFLAITFLAYVTLQ